MSNFVIVFKSDVDNIIYCIGNKFSSIVPQIFVFVPMTNIQLYFYCVYKIFIFGFIIYFTNSYYNYHHIITYNKYKVFIKVSCLSDKISLLVIDWEIIVLFSDNWF